MISIRLFEWSSANDFTWQSPIWERGKDECIFPALELMRLDPAIFPSVRLSVAFYFPVSTFQKPPRSTGTLKVRRRPEGLIF